MFDAEQQAFNYYNKINPEPEPKSYYSSKRLLDESKATEAEKKKQEGWQFPFLLTLTKDDHFQADVNTSVSSVHIPTSIYELGQCHTDDLSQTDFPHPLVELIILKIF